MKKKESESFAPETKEDGNALCIAHMQKESVPTSTSGAVRGICLRAYGGGKGRKKRWLLLLLRRLLQRGLQAPHLTALPMATRLILAPAQIRRTRQLRVSRLAGNTWTTYHCRAYAPSDGGLLGSRTRYQIGKPVNLPQVRFFTDRCLNPYRWKWYT